MDNLFIRIALSLVVIVVTKNTSIGQFIYVHEMNTAAPIEKPGYKLIWHDEFNGNDLQATHWNKSGINDDYTVNCERDITFNPGNISVSDGLLSLTLNTTDFDDCSNSGAEVKTFSIVDNNFHDYYFRAPCYIEIRAFGLPINDGQGSAAWIYNCDAPEYSEIDIWETDGKNKNRFQSNYWWQEGIYVPGCPLVGDEVRHDAPQVIKLKNLDDPLLLLFNKNFDLTAEWAVFGIEWTASEIKYFINDVLCYEIDLNDAPPEGTHYERPTGNLTLRIGVADNPIGNQEVDLVTNDMPKSMTIDYVRAYTPVSSKAGEIINYPDQICLDNSATISANFLPGVTYNFSSWAFDILPTANNFPNERVISLKSGLPSEQYYPVTLQTIFPNKYIETNTRLIYIDSNIPEKPSTSITTSQINSLCEFYAFYPIPKEHYQAFWSMNGATGWLEGENVQIDGQWYSRLQNNFLPDNVYTVFIQTANGCGMSEISDAIIFNTPMLTEDCLWKLENIEETQQLIQTGTPDHNCQIEIIATGNTLRIYSSEVNSNLQLRIHSISGEMVVQKQITEGWTEVNLNELPFGIYFIKALTDDGCHAESTILLH